MWKKFYNFIKIIKQSQLILEFDYVYYFNLFLFLHTHTHPHKASFMQQAQRSDAHLIRTR